MCGIAAIFAYSADAPNVDRDELIAIRDHMIARGPDGVGEWFSPDGRMALGHRRLAIIDLSEAGAQPMWNAEHTLCVTFNGEIYNYQALRAQLQARGCVFRTNSDTEVLLHLYAQKGADMVHDLRGMYAFAIWDSPKRSLFLARDPFGIKPLYYADDGRTVRAASQVKALLRSKYIDTTPDPAGHVGFFLWGHIPDPFTIFKGIKALPAGHTLTVRAGSATGSPLRLDRGEGQGEVSIQSGIPHSFCSIPEILRSAEQSPLCLDRGDATLSNSDWRGAGGEAGGVSSILREALADSISHHLIADVPVGVFQSAGLDSSTITAFASEVHPNVRTVTLGFNEYRGTDNDEVPLAENVARACGSNHKTVWVSRADFEVSADALLDAMDRPSIDGVNTYFVSKAARESGLKVALSGLGGDELFGGYPSFQDVPRLARGCRPFASVPALARGFRVLTAPVLKRFTSPKYAGIFEYGSSYGGAYLLRRGLFMPWELPEFLDPDLVREGWQRLGTLSQLQLTTDALTTDRLKVSALELTWYMRHQLLRDADWAGMAHSLEIRVPLVDLQLLRSLLPALRSETPPTKLDMARSPRLPLPAALLSRAKTGFSVPVHDWLLASPLRPDRGEGRGEGSNSGVPHSNDRGLRGWAHQIYSRFGGTSYTSPRSRAHPRSLETRTTVSPLRLDREPPSPHPMGRGAGGEGAEVSSLGSAPRGVAPGSTGDSPVPLGDPPGGFHAGVPDVSISASQRFSTSDRSPLLAAGSSGLRAFVLLTDGFGGFGGIAKFNRDFLSALCSHPRMAEVIALPRLAPEPIGTLPDKLTYPPGGLGGKRRYFRAVIKTARHLRQAAKSDLPGAPARQVSDTIIFCAHINLLPFAFIAHCILRAPMILNLHGIEAWSRHRNPFLVSMLRQVSAFVSVSDFTRERFLSWSRPGSQPFFILPNCVDLSAFGPGPRNPELVKRHGLGERKVIMTLARLSAAERYKGIDEVIEVLPQIALQVPNIAYLICGDGDDRARLEAKAAALGVKDRVVFAGRIAEKEKVDYFRLADAFVMPGRGEGFGIVYLEALACGAPVIGSKVDGSRDALLNGELGILVDPARPDEIERALIESLKRPRCVPARLEYFSYENFQKRMHKIVESLIENTTHHSAGPYLASANSTTKVELVGLPIHVNSGFRA